MRMEQSDIEAIDPLLRRIIGETVAAALQEVKGDYDPLFTEPEAAKKLKLGLNLLRDYRLTGVIDYVQLSGKKKIGYTQKNLDDFIERQTTNDGEPRRLKLAE